MTAPDRRRRALLVPVAALALALAVTPGCSSTRACRAGSVLLTVNLAPLTTPARALDVEVSLDGVPHAPLVFTPKGQAFAKSETLEVDLSPYVAQQSIQIVVIARDAVGGSEVGRFSVPPMALPSGCLAVAAAFEGGGASGGAGGGAGPGGGAGAGGSAGSGGGAGGSAGGQAGAPGAAGGGAGNAGAGSGGAGNGKGGGGGHGGSGGSGGALGGATGAGGGAGGSAGDPCVTNGSGAVAVLGCPCSASGTLACNGNAQAVTLICSNGAWAHNETCASGSLCDSRAGVSKGTCQPIVPACANAGPGQTVCDGAASSVLCGTDLVSDTLVQTCAGQAPACLNGACVACKPTATMACGVCNDGTATCDAAGAWGPCLGGTAKATYYRDADADGYGDPKMSMTVCGPMPAGYVANAQDCCDADANAHPGQKSFFTTADACGSSQVPDGFDYDCDGVDTTEGSDWNSRCVSVMSAGDCGCPTCFCNSTDGAAPVCGLQACSKYSLTPCGTARSVSVQFFESGTCTPSGGGSSAGLQGCR